MKPHESALLLLIFVCIVMVIAQPSPCMVPGNGQVITKSAVLCKGSYFIPEGLMIKDDSVSLDCDGSSLYGEYRGSGITLAAVQEVTVKNCNISKFESGILLQNAKRSIVKGSAFDDNLEAINLVDSFENKIIDNSAQSKTADVIMARSRFNAISFADKKVSDQAYCVDNSCDSASIDPCVSNDGYCSVSCTASEDNDCQDKAVPTPQQAIEYYRQSLVEKAVSTLSQSQMSDEQKNDLKTLFEGGKIELKPQIDFLARDEILRKLNISESQYQSTKSKLNITKYAYLVGNSTLFEVTIIALKPVNNLVMYEYFPENFPELSSEFMKKDYLEVPIGTIEIGGKAGFTYKAGMDSLLRDDAVSIPLERESPTTPPTPSDIKNDILNWIAGYIALFFGLQFGKYKNR